MPSRHSPALPELLRRIQSRLGGLMVFDHDVERTLDGAWRGRTCVSWGSEPPLTPTADWQQTCRQRLRVLPQGGLLAGFLGYEAGRWCERMPSPVAARPLPDIWLRPTQGQAWLDHVSGTWTVEGTDHFRAQWAAVQGPAAPPVRSPPASTAPPPLTGPSQRYISAVRHALEAIHDGEVYQVNLSWEASVPPLRDPLGTWLDLRSANPARRGAFIELDDSHAILSNSPETFLDVGADGSVESWPIKGTVPLASGAEGRRHLEGSEKERAELTMIVDLVRNDLGRVAPWGGVQASARQLRECGDLLHAEQRVRAHLSPDHDAIDAVAAAFPPGSVTGAPKVRAMSLIHQREPGPRGVYTGAIGWFAPTGEASLNVAIRTITNTPQAARFHLGAGIVADSDPLAEWHETLAKGRRIHQALHRARHAD